MIGTLILGAQAAGAGASAVGSYYAAKSQKSALRFQAQMAELSALRAERAAQGELSRGQLEEQRSRLATAQLKGRQTAGLAAGGVDVGYGSAALARASTDIMGEVDANTIRANAVRAAWGHRQTATDYKNEAALGRANASGISAGTAGATSLLGGATDVAKSYYGMKKSGAL